MPGGAKAVIVFQLLQVRNVFELAIPERSFLRESPVTTRLGRRACGQPNKQPRNVFAVEAVADKKFFLGPRLVPPRNGCVSGIPVGCQGAKTAWIGRRRR